MRRAGRRIVEGCSRLPASWAGPHPGRRVQLTSGAGRMKSMWRAVGCCLVGVTPCCHPVFLLYRSSYRQVPGGVAAVQVQPRNGEAIPMSRITIIILTLAALGMATLSLLCHLPDESGEPVIPGREEGHRPTALAPLIISLTATPPSKSCCQSSNLLKGRHRASLGQSAP